MTGMKIDEEFVPDRRIEVETDDEENEAEIDCDDDDDETGSECGVPYATAQRNSSIITDSQSQNHEPWPQTYRQSMDMYTMPLHSMNSFRGASELNLPIKSTFGSTNDQSTLRKRLISATSLDKDQVPVSTLPIKLSQTSNLRISGLHDLPPPVEQCTFYQSVLNATNVLCGIGILSMPYTFKEGGWLTLLLLMVFGAITCYTGILLKLCLERFHGLQTYPDIGQAAFGFFGRICIAMVLYMELFSSCVEYLIMMNDNLSALFPHAHLDIGGIHLDSYQFCAIISTLVILPTVWLRNLSLLSYISAGGVLTLATVVFCLLWLGVVDRIEYHPSGTALEVGSFPLAVGLVGFCYGGHSVFPNIYTSMKEPWRFPSALIISFSVSFVLYTAVGVYGYLMFGDSIKSQFTLNMPTNYTTSKVAAWTVVVAPVTKFALTLTPIAFGIEELLPPSQQNSYVVSIIIRTALTFFILLVALTVPYFGVVMGLIGSVLVMLVSIIFPCACYLRLLRGRTTTFQITICCLMIFAGLVCAVAGTYSSLASIPG
ncbi:amino acid transporter AVT1E-like [Cynara cardunculus var. scolymus]|uniref:amino acid transporter AVT1E-like n=1 Tax=Cynara cardunculus var. scolymus TaxID=59895 RepID=UPI000D62C480|nr:amino acid transporter AVT1E-like [Cynara cardunculus var. scolymus]